MAEKKAQMRMLAWIVIALAVSALLFWLGLKLSQKAEHTTWKSTCRASIESHARFKRLDLHSQIKCPTLFITIKEELKTAQQKDEALKRIADAMVDCWQIHGEGKLELFEGDGVFCSVCTIIDFKYKDAIIEDFELFLATQRYKDRTYLEYLSGIEKEQMHAYPLQTIKENVTLRGDDVQRLEGFVGMLSEKDIPSINTSRKYAIIFHYVKGRDYLAHYLKKTAGHGIGSLLIATGLAITAKGTIALIASGWTGVGAVVSGLVCIGGTLLAGVGAIINIITYYFIGEPAEWLANVMLVDWSQDTEQILRKDLGCQVIPYIQIK